MLETMIALLLPILAAVESSNNPSAIGDNSRAVGILQIWPIMVKDVNRISGKAYTLQDRYSKVKSYEMATIYLKHYGKPNVEYLARLWAGGPDANRQAGTRKYWVRVEQEIIRQRGEK